MRTRRIATIDFETDPFKAARVPEPFTCGIYWEDDSKEHYKDFWSDDPEELVTEVAHFLRDKNWRVYAHNGGKFDFFFLIQHASDIKGINGRIASLKIGKCLLVDSYLILPVPLSAYAKEVFDYDKLESTKRDRHKDEILRYQKSDCVNLYNWVMDFRELFGTPLTIASAAFSQMRKRGVKIEKHKNELWDAKFRPYYYGGRCEVFNAGVFDGNYNYVDINSAYPYAMLSAHPAGRDFDVLSDLPTRGECYFATIAGTSRGALPVRLDGGGIDFPHGGGVFDATGWEIQAGLETGTLDIDEVEKVYVPRGTQNFREFIEHFYTERLTAKAAGDEAKSLFYKLVMNSGYGKFALDPRKFKEYQVLKSGLWPDDGREWTINYEVIDHSIFSTPDPGDTFYNVTTSASITGYVRAYLWRAINRCTGVLYCDTDSILCKSHANLELGDDLGQWEVEAKVKRAHIGGKKMYALELADGTYKTASKGVRLPADDIKRIVNGEVITWKNEAPTFSLTKAPSFVERKIKATYNQDS